MSIRLCKAFGSSAEAWLGLQMNDDLAQAQKAAHGIEALRIKAPIGGENRATAAHR